MPPSSRVGCFSCHYHSKKGKESAPDVSIVGNAAKGKGRWCSGMSDDTRKRRFWPRLRRARRSPPVVQDVGASAELLETLALSLESVSQEKEALATEVQRLRLEAAQRQEEDASAEETARSRAEAMLEQAEEQAARAREDAATQLTTASRRLEDVLHVREQLLGELRGTLRAYAALLDQAEQGTIELQATEESVDAVPPPQHSDASSLQLVGAGAGADADGELFRTRVELDAGPFATFSELSAFESKLADLPKITDVRIREFNDERAAIDLELSEERPLVRDLAGHLPYRFAVMSRERSRLMIDVDGRTPLLGDLGA